MSISGNQISSLLSSYSTQSASSTSKSKEAGSSLGMNDFIQLLVAQMTNQDVMNPMDNTEFVAQMAQFSTLSAMQTLASNVSTQYASGLIGKEVFIEQVDSKTGKTITDNGVVQAIDLTGDSPVIIVNGKSYDLSSVSYIYDSSTITNDTNNADKSNSQNSSDSGS